MQKTPGAPADQRAELIKEFFRTDYSENSFILITEIIGDSKDELEGEEVSGKMLRLLRESETEEDFVQKLKEMQK